MATVLPAMQGKFGSTDFYIVTMPAKELTERLIVPKDVPGWEEMSIEERYQRDINYNRVKKQIAPYLVSDNDRFFGAFIVSMLHAENVEFEPLGDMGARIPKLYKTAGNAFGFLTLWGNEVLVPLDGQHRLAALEFAISGKDERQRPIDGLEGNTELANDVCTVILIKHDPNKSRKIFNKVNRYAKKTTKAEDLITADDDVIAVITREGVAEDIMPVRLINTSSNSLSVKAPEFTTLSTIYEATKFLLEDIEGKIDTQKLPEAPNRKIWENVAKEFWTVCCEKIDIFSSALHDEGESGDERRREIRKDFLLGKPVGQLALIQAIVRLCSEDDTGRRIRLEEVCERVNELDWRSNVENWQHVLTIGDRVVSGKTAISFAAQVISYWLGEKLDNSAIQNLKERFRDYSGGSELPSPPYRKDSA
jgi:DNA sulfur modification protein DndB